MDTILANIKIITLIAIIGMASNASSSQRPFLCVMPSALNPTKVFHFDLIGIGKSVLACEGEFSPQLTCWGRDLGSGFYLYGRPDFNSDGLKDIVIRESWHTPTRSKVSHFYAFQALKKGGGILLFEGAFTDLSLAETTNNGWHDVNITLERYDQTTKKIMTTTHNLTWNDKERHYNSWECSSFVHAPNQT